MLIREVIEHYLYYKRAMYKMKKKRKRESSHLYIQTYVAAVSNAILFERKLNQKNTIKIKQQLQHLKYND